MKVMIATTIRLVTLAAGFCTAAAQAPTGVLLPDGQQFVSWERPLQFTRTYYVDNGNAKAADANPGTRELPFLTIGKAAEVLPEITNPVDVGEELRVQPRATQDRAGEEDPEEETPGARVPHLVVEAPAFFERARLEEALDPPAPLQQDQQAPERFQVALVATRAEHARLDPSPVGVPIA